jgi:hypothetical protein
MCVYIHVEREGGGESEREREGGGENTSAVLYSVRELGAKIMKISFEYVGCIFS